MQKIYKIQYNWYPPHQILDNPDGWIEREVGKDNIVEIKEHPAMGEGDKWYYDIISTDGSFERIFNPNRIFFSTL